MWSPARIFPVVLLSIFFVPCAVWAAEGPQTAPAGSQKLSAEEPALVLVSISPLSAVVREVVPSGFEVKAFLPDGAQPESYEPSPRQLADVGRARWFVAAGVPFEEALLPRVERNFPQLRVIRPFGSGAAGSREGHGDHADGHLHEHPHRWLSPHGLDHIAQSVATSFIAEFGTDDTRSVEVRKRLSESVQRNAELDRQVRQQLGAFKGLPFFVYHPAWDSFAEHFGLTQEALEHHGHAPTARRMVEFVQMLKKSRTQRLFSQPQINPAPVDAAAKGAGVTVVLVDPLGRDVRKEILGFAGTLAEDFRNRGDQRE